MFSRGIHALHALKIALKSLTYFWFNQTSKTLNGKAQTFAITLYTWHITSFQFRNL